MKLRSVRISAVALVAALAAVTTPAYGQGATTSPLSGIVVDTSGGVIPGADVTVRNNATGTTFNAVTGLDGAFTIPALLNGTYTVTVSLSGFKTQVLNNVTVNAAVPASVRVTLEVGTLEESIIVTGEASSIIQTQTAAVSTTLNINQVSNLPLTSRNALDFVTNLPGVNTPGGNRQSTINGLARNAINITIDGINVQDNTLKSSDGFFTIVQPRLDAVEEITVTMAGQGAESSGQGAVQIQFVTRSGTNQLHGSGYHYYRNDKLNANTWFNERDRLPKAAQLQNQPGARVGGPVVIPGLFDGRSKAFFFTNYEEFRQPQQLTRNRTILSPRAQAGIFVYNTAAGVREVNLLAVAAANGHLATVDPTVAKVLADIRAATATTGTISDLADPLIQRYSFNVDQRSKNRFPTVRLDYNVTDRHRLMASWNYATFLSIPDTLNNRDPRFPGFPITATQTSTRIGVSSSLRSTLSSNLVNEFRAGGSGAPVQFFKELSSSMWGGTSVADMAGFHLNFEGACCGTGASAVTNPGNGPTPSSRNAYTFLIEDTVSWIKGRHSFSFGGSSTQVDVWLKNQTLVPTINLGVVTGDPALSMFTTANFPGASATNLNNAAALYAILVGRVSSITGNAGLNEDTGKYEYLGLRTQRGRLRELDFFAQDNWRIHPSLTINYGARYVVQLPFSALNNSYSFATLTDAWGVSGLASGCNPSRVTPETCNIFKAGQLGGKLPEFNQFVKGTKAYNTDWNNIAPSVGANWTPTAESGFLKALLGTPGDSSIRGGWARSFNRPGMSDFTGVFGANPGVLITADRTLGLGNLGTLPVLFRDRSRLGPPAFADAPQYPMRDVITEDVRTFDPDVRIPNSDTYSIGLQRAISRNMSVEARYVGTRSRDQWTTYNYNEPNIVENGFLQEFRNAQANLQANIAAGRGATFRYFGPGTGTLPLPIYLAYFSGIPASQAGTASLYTSTLFSNTNFVNPLAQFNPQPFTPAGTNANTGLEGSPARRANAELAGLPRNFFRANPDALGGVFVTGYGGFTRYNSLQLQLRRRMSGGLQFDSSYVFGREWQSDFFSFRRPRKESRDTGSPGGVDHVFKANWVYELPFGQGRRFGAGVGPVLDRVIGGWQIHGIARVQTGQLIDLGNVRLAGLTVDEVKKMFKTRLDGNRRVFMLPQDVIDNTVKAFSVSATTATGYGAQGPPSGRYFAPANGPDCIEIAGGFGDCGVRTLVVRGPIYKNLDISLTKLVRLASGTRFEFRVEMLNAFDWVNFTPVGGIGNTPANYEVTALTGESPSRRVQLVSRITW